MKIPSIIGLIIFIGCSSCNNENIISPESLCGEKKPTENIGWLQNAISDLEDDKYSYFNSAIYEDGTVIFNGNCNPAINYVSYLQNCSGDTLGFTTQFYQNLSEIKLLWKSDDSKCNF